MLQEPQTKYTKTSAASGTSMRLFFALKTFYYSIIYIPGLLDIPDILELRD